MGIVMGDIRAERAWNGGRFTGIVDEEGGQLTYNQLMTEGKGTPLTYKLVVVELDWLILRYDKTNTNKKKGSSPLLTSFDRFG